MKAIKLAWLEFRGLRLRWLVPVVLVLLPLLLAAPYLWSSWNPYGHLHAVPVAVVNSDRPVDSEGGRIDAGAQFVRQLKATGLFDWHFVGTDEARQGLAQGRYYFTIEVPRDFSATLATTPDPNRAKLLVTGNDANNYLVGIMTDTVRSRLQNQINAAAHSAYARALYGELDDVRRKLELASEASSQLVRGTDLAKQGSSALAGGLDGARDGAGEVAEGARRVSAATAELDKRVASVTEVTSGELPGAVNGLVHASNASVNSLSAIKTATGFFLDRANDGMGTLEALGKRHPPIGQDPVYQRALENARQLAGAAANADGEAQRALDTSHEANTRALALQDGVVPLQERVEGITVGTSALRAGAAQVTGGADGLSGGLGAASSGSTVLRSGADQLHEGAKRLDGLVGGSLERIPPTNPDQVAHAADVLGSPAEIEKTNLNPAHVYGRGMAPLFFSLALWVLGLAAYLLLRPLNPGALTTGVHAATLAVAGWLPAAVLGVAGGHLLFGVLDVGLGLNPDQPLWTIGLVSLGTATFVAIGHFLRTALGLVGTLLSLVLLIVQLPASGGLYPLETMPVPFRAVHPFLPMSYLVDGLRCTVFGGLQEHLTRDAAVLGGFLLAFLILTTVVIRGRRVWTVRRMHPRVEL